VAGVAALVKAKYPGLAPDLLAKALSSTTHYRPAGGYDQRVGFGTVNADAALTAAGQLSSQRAAETGTAASNNFGGGPSAAPASPVASRGSGQLILFALLTLTALVLVAAAVSRLAVLKKLRRRSVTAASVPVDGPFFDRPSPAPPLPNRHQAPHGAAAQQSPPQFQSPYEPRAQSAPQGPYVPDAQSAPQGPYVPDAQSPPQGPHEPRRQPMPQVPYEPQGHPPSRQPPTSQAPRDPYQPHDHRPSRQPPASQVPRDPYGPHAHPPSQQPPASDAAPDPYEPQATRPLPVPQEQERPPGWWPAPDADD
jgi:hypothetical protein